MKYGNFPTTTDCNSSTLGSINCNPASLAMSYVLVSSFEYIPFFRYGAVEIAKAKKVYSLVTVKKRELKTSSSDNHPLYGLKLESDIANEVADIMDKMNILAASLARFFLIIFFLKTCF
jgi:hypothetical protein